MSVARGAPTGSTVMGPTVMGSAIAATYPDRVVVRGLDLCSDLIGKIGFTDYFLFLLLGERPSQPLRLLVDATLVAIAEHGLVPSVQTARMTYAAAPDALQGAVAAGLLGCGSVILGASETAGHMLAAIVKAADGQNLQLDDVAEEHLTHLRASGSSLPGFGHPLHKPQDPRALRLLAYAQELKTAGRHVDALLSVQRAVPRVYGRPLPLNVSGAIPAVLLDAGFPIHALKGIPLIARCAALVGHLFEEQSRSIGFKLADAAAAATAYDGPPVAAIKAS